MEQEQNDCYEKGKAFTLAISWEDSELFPEGLILKILGLGKHLLPSYWMNIFFWLQNIKIILKLKMFQIHPMPKRTYRGQ